MFFLPCKSPLVVLDNLFRHEKVNSVVMNNYEGGYQATNFLHQAGHREIGHITSSVQFSNAINRREGFIAALTEKEVQFTEEALWYVTPTIEGSYQDMLTLLNSGRNLPTAFFAVNDIVAIGCMRAMHESGVQIPDDVSIIGMDNMSISVGFNPPLSTVKVYRQELGFVAVQILQSIVSNVKSGILKIELSVDIVKRGSVKDL